MNKVVHLFAVASLLSVALGGGAAEAVPVPDPAEAYFASVSANGDGCPPGSWEAAISADGKAFTVTFSRFEVLMEAGDNVAAKGCTLTLNLHTPPGISLSAVEFVYRGYALLAQAGMSASQGASYEFGGSPVPAESDRPQFSGQFDDSYLATDEILLPDDVGSQQGAVRTLSVPTVLTLNNNPAGTGTAYLNTTSIDGTIRAESPSADLSIAKSCSPGTVVPGGTLTCTVTVANAGPTTAANITVTDSLDENTILLGTPSGGGFTCATGPELTCTKPTQPVGTASFTYTLRVSPELGPGVILTNTATVGSDTADPDPGNNDATATATTRQFNSGPGNDDTTSRPFDPGTSRSDFCGAITTRPAC